MPAIQSMVSERNRHQVEQAQTGPCACDQQGGVGGWHYSMADDYAQARIRERSGIKGFGRGTVAGMSGSRR